jgi:hypothetical protein
MKIAKDLDPKIHASDVIYGSEENYKKLEDILDNDVLNKNITIWENESGVIIKNDIGGTVTLNDMPDLSAYEGKIIRFFTAYGTSDAIITHDFVISGNRRTLYLKFSRNYSGNDIWEVLVEVTNLKSGSWDFQTRTSYVISTTGSISINNVNNNIRLFKVEVIG